MDAVRPSTRETASSGDRTAASINRTVPLTARIRRPRWSVRVRILASILAVTAVGMTLAGFTSYLTQRERVLATVDSRLVAIAENVRTIVSGTEPTGPVTPESSTAPATTEQPPQAEQQATTFADANEALHLVMQRLIPERNESALGLIDGAPVYVPATDVAFRLDNRPALVERVVSETADDSIRMGSFVDGPRAMRYIAVPFSVGEAPQTAIYLAAYDIHAELADTNAAFTTYAVVAAAALLVIGLVGWFVAGRLLRPIRRLRQTASRITATDRTERIPVVGNDDVSALTSTVNDMLDRLDESLTAQRQLLDDVRHELKTPITIVRGHLELTNPDDPKDVRETIGLAIDELDRMSGLVDDIEALAISEQRGLLKTTPTDVDDLTRQVFAKASALGGHNWVLDSTASVVASLDARRITQALLQLADNAAKYSGDGSRIRIGSRATERDVRFWVADDGPGIPVEAQTRIFERFGRAATGRGQSGSGLGLAIVGSIATGHGGRVSVDSAPGEGATFTIVIPLTSSTQQHSNTPSATPQGANQ